MTEERAAEFLLVDRLFPRSIAYNLDRARTNLEFRDVGEILADLPAQMREVQRACATASDLIRDRYFLPASTVMWSQEAL